MRFKSLIVILIIGLAACTSAPATVLATLPPPSPIPTATTQPTQPPPTATPRPTNTPRPTDTPRPTASPTPPPEPWTLAGSGDSIADLGHPCLAAVAHITGNASAAFFAVTNLDANNESIDLLVNTVDPYDGYRPFDWADDACTTRFEVKASDDWTIEILPLAHLAADPGWWLTIPGTREGAGDAVFLLDGTPDTAQISGNAGGNYFGVIGWGTRSDLLVNTVDPYDGTVLLDKRTFAIEVRASGPWTIAVK